MTPVKFLLDVLPEIQKFIPHLKIELISFENTPGNSVEGFKNLGNHIDIIAGLYDDDFLKERGCKAAHLYDKRLLFAIPVTHPLSGKKKITLSDLKGKKVMVIKKNWNKYIDELRDDLAANGTEIEDFDMFKLHVFNRAARENVHPLLRIVPADWKYRIPFGIFYSPTPTKQVKDFISALQKIPLR